LYVIEKTMRFSLVFIFLVVLTIPVIGQTYREVDLRVNGIGEGSSYSAVIRKLGRPLRSTKQRASEGCSGSAETYLKLFYPGLELELIGDGRGRNFFVHFIEVVSKRWSASGVSIGASAKDVVTRFGEPISKEYVSGETVYDYVTVGNLGGVNFYFRGDKLVRAVVRTTLC